MDKFTKMKKKYHRSHPHVKGTYLGSTNGGTTLEPKIIFMDAWGQLDG